MHPLLAHRRVCRSLTDASVACSPMRPCRLFAGASADRCVLVAHLPMRRVIDTDMPPLLRVQVSHSIVNWHWICELTHHSLVCRLLARRRVRRLLTDASIARSPTRPLLAHLLTCHRHGNTTVTMSSGKPFDRQSALALRADASLDFVQTN